MELNTRLSQGQAKFFLMLERAPFLAALWNIQRAEYDPQLVENYLVSASRGEVIMARFFLGIWCNNNKFNFDFADAAAHLDPTMMKIITDWLTDPFWP